MLWSVSSRSYVVPGISDHDGIPIVIISCKPRIIKQIPRKIYMYHKTDLQALKIDLMKWSDEFKLRDTSVNTVNEMFQEFQTVLESAMNSHILYNTLFSREENFAKSEFEIFSREDIFANILFTRKYLPAKISSRENILSRKYLPANTSSRDFFPCRKYVG